MSRIKTNQNLPFPPLKQQSGKNSFGAPLTQIGPSSTGPSSGPGVDGFGGEHGHWQGWHGALSEHEVDEICLIIDKILSSPWHARLTDWLTATV